MTSKIESVKIIFKNKEVVGDKLTISSEIQIDVESAWEKVKSSDLLEFVSKGKIDFKPTAGRFPIIWKQGMIVTTKMILYGCIPFGGLHTLQFVKIDDEKKILETKENDFFAKIWNHKISMISVEENTILYEDEVIIYGGVLTRFISRWANSFYKHRQNRWKLLVSHIID